MYSHFATADPYNSKSSRPAVSRSVSPTAQRAPATSAAAAVLGLLDLELAASPA